MPRKPTESEIKAWERFEKDPDFARKTVEAIINDVPDLAQKLVEDGICEEV